MFASGLTTYTELIEVVTFSCLIFQEVFHFPYPTQKSQNPNPNSLVNLANT